MLPDCSMSVPAYSPSVTEILRQPVHTSVAIEKRDFDYYLAEDHLHVAIHMKDFKAAIAHAETANAKITARFTRPSRPLQFAYESEGVKTEFTLMTRGESPGEDVPGSSRAAPQLSARQTPAPVQISQRNTAPDTAQMPPPRSRSIRPLTGTSTRASQSNTETQQPPPSMEFDSLFVPADDDRQWDVPNDEDEGPVEDELGWDATGEQVWLNPPSAASLLLTTPPTDKHRPWVTRYRTPNGTGKSRGRGDGHSAHSAHVTGKSSAFASIDRADNP